MADDARWVNHTNEVLSLANSTMLQIVDPETSLRGYLIAGERQFLAPLERADGLPGDAGRPPAGADPRAPAGRS
nr:CHASE3 domain-containing protein [Nannocystis sp. SCPEA4]